MKSVLLFEYQCHMFRMEGLSWTRCALSWLGRVLLSLVVGVALLVVASSVQAGSEFTPQSGSWIITAENDGRPGRGMAIDVQGDTMVMQVYNYRADGSSTFHMAVGQLNGARVLAPMLAYRGGRFFGSGPLTGAIDTSVGNSGNVGNVEVNFTSASTATIRFPGEAAVSMQRFKFESTPSNRLAPTKWLIALRDSSGESALAGTATSSNPDAAGLQIVQIELADRRTVDVLCRYSAGMELFECSGVSAESGRPNVVVNLKRNLNLIGGTVQWGAVSYRLVGKRVHTLTGDVDAISSGVTGQPMPVGGTWVISAENDGSPGRGLAIDVQDGTLVTQVYNYRADGSSTFHLGVGPYAGAQAKALLRTYRDGRSFGGPARSGTETAAAGEVTLQFTSPTRGFVSFPGESAKAIEHFQFTEAAPNPMSLMGTWVFADKANKVSKQVRLSKVAGIYASTDGDEVRCYFLDAAKAKVRCTEVCSTSGSNQAYARDYRFTLEEGMGMGFGRSLKAGAQVVANTVPDENQTGSDVLTVLRIEDQRRMQLGIEPTLPTPPFKIAGFNINMWGHDRLKYTPNYMTSIDNLAKTGSNMVMVTTAYFQNNATSSDVFADPRDTESDENLAKLFDGIRSRGMMPAFKYTVIPKDNSWSGAIMPADVNAWFAAYTSHLVRLAKVAQAHGVGVIFIANEMQSMAKPEYAKQWSAMIASVRAVFSGQLSWNAILNSRGFPDGEAFTIPVANQLDFIGLSAYDPLTNKMNPTVDELRQAWYSNRDGNNLVAMVKSLHQRTGRPIVFSEITYRSVDGNNRDPGDWQAKPTDVQDPQEQADCYEAFMRVWTSEAQPWMLGVLWWQWMIEPVNTDRNVYHDQTPQNLPAQQVITEWFTGVRR